MYKTTNDSVLSREFKDRICSVFCDHHCDRNCHVWDLSIENWNALKVKDILKVGKSNEKNRVKNTVRKLCRDDG